ncbi:hypothetical protein GDO86_000851 [Hymenochirus boettgeri]|uniref:TBC1 domain family member 2A n=1 Tax=Hymenochirus boettgeri TaxID=247094 RepID=A0A8T2KDJ6_9PIPI|nr:hypothetical protein GDO86_000851 [Hymenochirus boettgeri]
MEESGKLNLKRIEIPSEAIIENPKMHVNAEQSFTLINCDKSMPERPNQYSCINPSKMGKKTIPKKLCGYLYKLGMKSPLKVWKCRFFTYDEKKGQLLYYRIATDVCPLGSIDLSTAIFDCKVEMEEGTFEIKTPSRVFILKAVNSHTMMYWLQQLQRRRWELCRNESGLYTDIEASSDFQEHVEEEYGPGEEDGFLPPVKTPTEVVGLKVPFLPAPQDSTSVQNISLKHPWTELQNTVRTLCSSKITTGVNRNAFNYNETEPVLQEKSERENLTLESIIKPVQKLSPFLARRVRKQNGCASSSQDGIITETVSTDKAINPQQQVQALNEELKSQKELVKLLHKALESAHKEKRVCKDYMNASQEKDRLELVRHKVRQIEDMRQRLEVHEQQKKDLEQSIIFKDSHIVELKEHVQLLMEKNSAKQQVILKQTEKLLSLSQNETDVSYHFTTDTLRQQCKKIDGLMDDIAAYRTQNQFLNSEIHQVTNLWRNAAEKEKSLLRKCSYLEARNCQIESKYLILLRKLQDALPNLDAEYCEIIKNLIEGALQSDGAEHLGMQYDPVSEYDDYGFMVIPQYEAEHLKLLAKIQALEIRSNKLLTHDIVDKPLRTRWNSIGELSHSTELKNLVRCGIPAEHRKRMWKWICSGRLHINSSHYANLLQKCEHSQHPATQQIELDLHRTLNNNKHFSCPSSEFIQRLRRVLLAFSWQNPTIGYCQGLNRLAAVALLVLEEEESAFWCLVDIVENIMPAEYYSSNLLGSQVDQRVFKDFFSEKLPRLTAHFQQHKIDLSLITFNWFLVIFIDSLVSDILLRVWDAFLYEGTKVMFRYALAIFKYNKEEILKLTDESDIYQYLTFLPKTICDGRNRRAAHMEKFKSELAELEQMKKEYVKQKEELGSKDLDMAVSEDEEDI